MKKMPMEVVMNGDTDCNDDEFDDGGNGSSDTGGGDDSPHTHDDVNASDD